MNENQNINVNENEVREVQGEQVIEEKMLPQSKVNEVVEGRIKREREKLNKEWQEKFDALEESLKLQAMSDNQVAEYQAQKEREAFEKEREAFYAERDAFNKSKYEMTIQDQLKAKGLPTDLADLLINLDAETVAKKIDSMANAIGASVNSEIENKLKSSSIPQEPTKQPKRLLSLDEISNMSKEEYRANRELIQESLTNMQEK